MYHKEILWLEEFVKQVDDGIYVNQANPGRAYKALAAAYSVVSLSTTLPCVDPKGGQGVRPRNFTPSSAHQRNAIEMAFRWRTDGGPIRILVRTPSPFCKI